MKFDFSYNSFTKWFSSDSNSRVKYKYGVEYIHTPIPFLLSSFTCQAAFGCTQVSFYPKAVLKVTQQYQSI